MNDSGHLVVAVVRKSVKRLMLAPHRSMSIMLVSSLTRQPRNHRVPNDNEHPLSKVHHVNNNHFRMM